MGVPAIKIGSGDLTNHPPDPACGRTGIPLILSTGMAALDEVKDTVRILREERCAAGPCCIGVSVSGDVAGVNLRAMATLREQFGVPVGYSDHTGA
jgi:sialic acid synthase SpsE